MNASLELCASSSRSGFWCTSVDIALIAYFCFARRTFWPLIDMHNSAESLVGSTVLVRIGFGSLSVERLSKASTGMHQQPYLLVTRSKDLEFQRSFWCTELVCQGEGPVINEKEIHAFLVFP